MKKSKRIIICLFAAVLMSGLTSCRWLEERRAKHAVWANEEETEILWKGQKFLELPKSDLYSDFTGKDWIYVTAPDVPLFLAPAEGRMAAASHEDTILYFSEWNKETERYYQRCFAREDHYEGYRRAVENAKMDRYCVEMNAVAGDTGEEIPVIFLLDDETVKLLEPELSSDIPAVSDEEVMRLYNECSMVFFDDDYLARTGFTFCRCDEAMFLREELCGLSVFEEEDGTRKYLISSVGYLPYCKDHVLADDSLYKAVMEQLKALP